MKLYYRFGAYQTIIELIRALFPDGEDKPPRLKDEFGQGWALNALANSYALSGQPRRTVPLFKISTEIAEKRGDKKNVAITLGNLADDQNKIGELDTAESNLRRRIEICGEIKDEFKIAVGHAELGRLLAYRGKFEESENEFVTALELNKKSRNVQFQGLVWAYRSLRALLMSSAEEAHKHARKARELADDKKFEIKASEYALTVAHGFLSVASGRIKF